ERGPLRARQGQEVAPKPFDYQGRQNPGPKEHEPGAKQKAHLELEMVVEGSQRTVVLIEAPTPGVSLGMQSETQYLEAHHTQNGRKHTGHTRCRPPAEFHQTKQYEQLRS